MTKTNPTARSFARWPRRFDWKRLKLLAINQDVVLSDELGITEKGFLSVYAEAKPDKKVYFFTRFSLEVVPGPEQLIMVIQGLMDPCDAKEKLLSEAPVEFPRVLKLLEHYRFMGEDKQAQRIL